MKDSPNGKRYGHRGRGARIVEAYGFDLSPRLHRAGAGGRGGAGRSGWK